jgi:hypothetical protein
MVNAAFSATLARHDAPVVLFVHIPKTAGTSLNRILRLKYGLWPPTNLFDLQTTFGYNQYGDGPTERLEKIASLHPAEAARIRLIHGHFGFGIHEYVTRPYVYLTFLRDPVERVISSYHQLRRGQQFDDDALSLADFLDQGERYFESFYIDNGHVRALAGAQGLHNNRPFGTVRDDLLDQAKHNLKTQPFFVGISERFDESLLLLKRAMGWRTCYYARANVAPRRKRYDDVAPDVRARLRELTRYDQRLYDWACQHFEAQIKAMGTDFEEEVAWFRRVNRLYSRTVGRVVALLPSLKRTLEQVDTLD